MKMVLNPVKFVNAQALTGNFNSSAINVLQSDVVDIQCNYTGSPSGTLTIQGSLDGVNYAAIPFQSGTSVVTSLTLPTATSPILVNIINAGLKFVRISYTFTSGSGSMDAYISYRRTGE